MHQNKPEKTGNKAIQGIGSKRLLEEIMESQERKDPRLADKQRLLIEKLKGSPNPDSGALDPSIKLPGSSQFVIDHLNKFRWPYTQGFCELENDRNRRLIPAQLHEADIVTLDFGL